MNKKIIELSKIFIKDYFQNLYIFNNNKKINKKSAFSWLLVITVLMITFMSFKIIKMLEASGKAVLFLQVYLPILASIFMFQAILICSNVFFFSKDLEYILPLPIKPVELLIAKFNNVISITYSMEILFLLMPLVMYGILITKSIIYYLTMILVLIIFPIFLILIISIIMLIIMQLTKIIKNKEIFQILIVFILSFIMTMTAVYLLNSIFNDGIVIEVNEDNEIKEAQVKAEILSDKVEKLNDYFVIINPCISLLTNLKISNIIWQLLKLILLCTSTFLIFILCGKILYLNSLLKNIAYVNKKKNKKKKIKNKYKKKSIGRAYIKNEFRKIIKNPTFFTQCIFQYIFMIIVVLIIVNIFLPITLKEFEEKNLVNEMGINDFALQCLCIIIGIIQIIYTIGNLSITAISRDGKNATVIKYIPVSLFKQFIWKNIPQILINIIPIIGMVIVVSNNIPKIPIWYYIIGVFIAIILNLINSFLMVIVDLRKPNLDWVVETSPLKDNGNKLYQYVTTIIIVLLLMYFTRIFSNVNIIISLSCIIGILSVVLIGIIIYIKKNIDKLFKKII